MGLPWGYGPVQATATGGQPTLLELRVPHRGIIRSLHVAYDDGSQDSGSFEIYASQAAAEEAIRLAATGDDSSSSLSSSMGSVGLSPGAYSVSGVQQLVNGKFDKHELRWAYINRDGTPTNGVRRLWMVVTPAGIGPRDLVLSMTITTGLMQ